MAPRSPHAYDVRFAPAAERAFDALTPEIQRRLRPRFDALAIIHADVAADSGLARMVENERRRLHLAEMVREAREAAGISQAELSIRIGTTQSVVSRIESEDYTGISVSSLLEIAAALHRRLSLALVSRGA